MTHAFFKALLFLGAGSVIHALSGEQDLRHMGGLKRHLPWTHATMLIACLAISGIPPFSGFFSKDLILEADFESHWRFLWVVGLVTAGLTAFYMFRLVSQTFEGTFRGTAEQAHHLHESPATMTMPLIVLAGLAAVGGFAGVPAVMGGSDRTGAFLEPILLPIAHASAHAGHELPHATEWLLMGVSAFAVGGILLAWKWCQRWRPRPATSGGRLPGRTRWSPTSSAWTSSTTPSSSGPSPWPASAGRSSTSSSSTASGTPRPPRRADRDLLRFLQTGNVRNYASRFCSASWP
jgi:NADH-quinone oxidoreductase subunit L